eukprot:scaffold227921_cov27-Tisochrysis_lutea.AAC.1
MVNGRHVFFPLLNKRVVSLRRLHGLRRCAVCATSPPTFGPEGEGAQGKKLKKQKRKRTFNLQKSSSFPKAYADMQTQKERGAKGVLQDHHLGVLQESVKKPYHQATKWQRHTKHQPHQKMQNMQHPAFP